MRWRRPRGARLVLAGPAGRKEMPVEESLLTAFLDRARRHAGTGRARARLERQWEEAGILTRAELLPLLPPQLAPPESLILRAPWRGPRGFTLQVELRPDQDPEEYAEDLLAVLRGASPVLRTDAAPAAAPGCDPSGEDLFELAVEAPRPAPQPREEVQVLPPGTRWKRKEDGRRWRLGPADVFGLVGPVHPADVWDEGLEIEPEDLPWLNPGDRILSDRRGPCRILQVLDGGAQVLVRTARGRTLLLQAKELCEEFSFDDRPRPLPGREQGEERELEGGAS